MESSRSGSGGGFVRSKCMGSEVRIVSPDLREGILKCVMTDLMGLMKVILGKC
jgi:hypothetical protein